MPGLIQAEYEKPLPAFSFRAGEGAITIGLPLNMPASPSNPAFWAAISPLAASAFLEESRNGEFSLK